MSKEQIISKGKYSYTQPENMVGVKQYLFVRESDGKKRLLLRFANNRQEKCSKFAFIVYRLDAKGNVLGQDKYESADREFGEREVFSFDRKILVEERCTDFKVQMVYARYGNYTYNVEHNNVSVAYSEKNLATLSQSKSISKIKPRKINARTFDMPWIFVVLSMIVLALAFAACGFLIKDFKEKQVDFTLNGVSYAFVDRNAKDDVIITGCADTYREITLSGDIEGHRVVGIDEDAFAGNQNLVKLTIYDLDVPSKAFEGCESLEVVSLNNITSIGISAFEGCESLETVTVTEGKKGQLLKIGTKAFSDCDALESVEINQTIVYGYQVDYFAKSNNLQSLKLRNFAYTMKNVNSSYITRLGALFGESANKTKSDVKLVNLTIENMDSVPESFVRGFKSLQSVTINGTEIKTIGNYAFADCEAMTTLETKGQLLSIGDYAFMGTDLETLDLTKVKSLGEGVFKDNDKLTSVKGFGAGGFDNIPKNTFAGCKSLSTFTIHKNIKHVFSGAFENSGLTKIVIPVGVSFDSGILKGCNKLEDLEVYEFGSAGFVGQLFGAKKDDSSDKVAGYIPATLTKITLGSGMEINAGAFKGCTNVKTINLPGDIITIGDYAFAGCKKLSVVDISKESTMLKTIGKEAFADCRQLKYVPLLSTIESIGAGALKGCDGLTSLELPFLGATPALDDAEETVAYIFGGPMPASVKELSLLDASMKELPESTFANCSGVNVITIPSGIKVIGSYAFKGCSSLTSVVLSGISNKDGGADLSSMNIIGESAFEGCSSLSSVKLNEKLESIAPLAFANSGLTKISIPEGVDYIGQGILKDCEKLGVLSVPYLGAIDTENGRVSYLFGDSVPNALKSIEVLSFNDNVIGTDAFRGCSGVTSVSVPSSITIISEDAFRGCESLGSFDFSSIDTIGDGAFFGCAALKNIDLSGVEVIGESAFARCTNITKAVLTDTLDVGDGAFEGCTALTSVTLGENTLGLGKSVFYETAIKSIELPEGLEEIKDYTFGLCASLERVKLPSTLTYIGEGAFSGTAITEIEIPNGVSYVGGFAFKDTAIKSLTIPKSATSIGINMLVGCNSIESLELPLTENIYGNERSLFGYLFQDNPFPQSLKRITISDSSDGYIREGFFAYSQYLEEIIIEDGIYDIYSDAFLNCSELRFVSLPGTISYVDYSAFANCYRLYEIAKPWDSDVSSQYTIQFTDIEDVRAPFVEKDGYVFSRYKVNGNDMWYLVNYPKVENVSVPEGLAYMGEAINEYVVPSYLFQGNETVKTIKLSKGATIIGERAFAECQSLTSVELPDSVTHIKDGAFYYCTSLEKVQMPKSLAAIGTEAFYCCESLNNIRLYEKVSSIGENAFIECDNLFDVYNASKLSLVAGSRDYGYVARRAVKVHTNMDEASSIEVTINGMGTFRRSGGAWLLIAGEDAVKLEFKSFKVEDATVDSYRIAEGAFSGMYSIKEIVIGNEIKQIQKNAFSGCGALVSLDCSLNKSLTEIEEGTFEGCGALKTVKLPLSVKTIGDRAFNYCSMLTYITMPTALEVIGEGAFNECYRLISVKLNKNVKEIRDGAFSGCTYLLEVYDLSDALDITAGNYSHGGVAKNAAAVYTSEKDELERREENGLSFIKGNNVWYLYDFVDGGKEILTIPNYGASLVMLPSAIMNGSFKGIVIPANLSDMKYGAIRYCSSFNDVYYTGSQDEWFSVRGIEDLIGIVSVYYKESCVHKDSVNAWTYDSKGVASKEMCPETKEITAAPTCYKTGIMTYTCACEGCGSTRTEGIERLEHEFEGNTCKHCKGVKTAIGKDNLKAYEEAGIISIDGFTYNDTKKCFESTNKAPDSASSFIIEATGDTTVRFTIEASSKKNFDYVTVSKNGIQSTAISGREAEDCEILLKAGDVLIISYEKDNVGSQNNDCGYIKSLQIIEEKQQQSN